MRETAGSPIEADVAIVGASAAGSAVALGLRQYTSLRVVMFDRLDHRAARSGEHLPAGTASLLTYLGLDPRRLQAEHFMALTPLSAWNGAALRSGGLALQRSAGWRLDRSRFDAWLAGEAQARGTDVMMNCAVREAAFDNSDGRWSIAAESDAGSHCVRSRYLVDASGSGARLARKIGAHVVTDDLLYAVVARYTIDAGELRSLLIESAALGWWYVIAVPRDVLIVAFITDIGTMRVLRPASERGWTQALRATQHVSAIVGYRRPHAIDTRAIRSQMAVPAAGPNWIAVGDAAMAADPIASLGIGFALSSGAHAARALTAELQGQPSVREAYIHGVERTFSQYRALRRHVYATERRWAQESFWSARRSGSA